MESSVDEDFVISNQDLKKGKELASGACGTVYEGKWLGNAKVAIKQLFIKTTSESTRKEFEQEFSLLRKLRHPNVILLYGYCPDPLSLVMELMQQSLYDYLKSVEVIPWKLRYQIGLDIANGLHYIHKKDIIHRDLKSCNILLDGNHVAKISDFGFSKIKKESKAMSTQTRVGTVRWMAPELLNIRPRYSRQSDIYALGMVLWELAARVLPFEEAENELIIQAIKNSEREEIPIDCPESFAQVIKGCWEQEPKNRIDIEVIKKILNENIPIIDPQNPQLVQPNQVKTGENNLSLVKKASKEEQKQAKKEENKVQERQIVQPTEEICQVNILSIEELSQYLSKLSSQNITLEFMLQSTLNKISLTDKTNLLLQLSKFRNEAVDQNLIQIIKVCKNQSQLQQAASNALTILNYMNFKFNNLIF